MIDFAAERQKIQEQLKAAISQKNQADQVANQSAMLQLTLQGKLELLKELEEASIEEDVPVMEGSCAVGTTE